MRIVIVIPARDGSKGIPQKNIRTLGGKPLISYPIENALNLKLKDEVDIAVTSDSVLIEEIVKFVYPEVSFIKRKDILSKDNITLDPVVYDAVQKMEEQKKKRYDYVFTLLPTMPLLSIETIMEAYKQFLDMKKQSLILVNQHNHLYWDDKGNMITARENRQWLKPIFEETGGLAITHRDFLIDTGMRVSENPCLWVCPPDESVDINSWADLLLAESLNQRKRIGIYVRGNHKIGLGHVHRAITLALRLVQHEILFFISEDDYEAEELVKSYFFEVVKYKSIPELCFRSEELEIKGVISDAPNGIDHDFASFLMMDHIPIISTTETKSGCCDLAINGEYEYTGEGNGLYGYRYNIIREDIMMYPVKNPPEKIKNILVTMGNSDPDGVTLMLLNWLKDLKNKKTKVLIGRYFDDSLKKKIKTYKNIEYVEDAKHIATHLNKADLVITSNSSNVYNCVCLGCFTIAISKVYEEISHLFPRMSNSVMYLGYYKDLTPEKFESTILKFDMPAVQVEYYRELLKHARELRNSQKTIIDKINEILTS